MATAQNSQLNLELLFQLYQIMGNLVAIFSKAGNPQNLAHLIASKQPEQFSQLTFASKSVAQIVSARALSYNVIKYVQNEKEGPKYIIFSNDNEINVQELKEIISYVIKDVSKSEKTEFILISKSLAPLLIKDKPLALVKDEKPALKSILAHLQNLQSVKQVSKTLQIVRHRQIAENAERLPENLSVKEDRATALIPLEQLLLEDQELAAFNIKLLFADHSSSAAEPSKNLFFPQGIVSYYFEQKKAEALRRKNNKIAYKKNKAKYISEEKEEKEEENFLQS